MVDYHSLYEGLIRVHQGDHQRFHDNSYHSLYEGLIHHKASSSRIKLAYHSLYEGLIRNRLAGVMGTGSLYVYHSLYEGLTLGEIRAGTGHQILFSASFPRTAELPYIPRRISVPNSNNKEPARKSPFSRDFRAGFA